MHLLWRAVRYIQSGAKTLHCLQYVAYSVKLILRHSIVCVYINIYIYMYIYVCHV